MIEKMDFDIGSLFYIVITIVIVIAGIVGKKKKPAAGSRATGAKEGAKEKSTSGGFFGKLEAQLENFAAEAKQSMGNLQQEPVIEEDEVVVERDYFESMSDDYEKRKEPELKVDMAAYEGLYSPDDIENDPLMEAEGISVTDALELIHLDEYHTGSFDDQQIIEDFDARTAIIYSAIINRREV